MQMFRAYSKFILSAIDDNSGDLLIEEEKNCGQGSREHSPGNDPPRIVRMNWVNDPAAFFPRWFESTWDLFVAHVGFLNI